MNDDNRTYLSMPLCVCVLLGTIYMINIDSINRVAGQFSTGAGRFLTMAGWIVIAIACLFAVVLIKWGLSRISNKLDRQRDGSYRLRKHLTMSGWVTVDINRLPTPFYSVNFWTGEISLGEESSRQAVIDEQRNMIAALQATNAGDGIFEGNYLQRGMVPKLPTQKAQRAPTPRIIGTSTPEIEMHPTAQLTVASDPVKEIGNAHTDQIPLGQGKMGIVSWERKVLPHLRLHGMTQSGKSNMARWLAAAAIKAGCEVTIFDRRNFKDWSAYKGVATLVNANDGRATVNALENIYRLYRDRDKELAAARNAEKPDPYFLPLVTIFEELGAALRLAKKEGWYADVEAWLVWIAKEGGACSVHMILTDQTVDTSIWPSDLSDNAMPITGKLPINSQSKGGYYHADKLQRGEFHFEGQVFTSWLVDDAERHVLGQRHSGAGPKQIELKAEPAAPTSKYRKEACDWMKANAKMLHVRGAQSTMMRHLGCSKATASALWNENIDSVVKFTTEETDEEAADRITTANEARALLQQHGHVDISER